MKLMFLFAAPAKCIRTRLGNFLALLEVVIKHIIVVHVIDPNVILATDFKNKTKIHLTDAHMRIKKELNKCGLAIKLHVLDNKAL